MSVSDRLRQIHDELSEIYRGTISDRTVEDLDTAMRLLSKSADRERRIERLVGDDA